MGSLQHRNGELQKLINVLPGTSQVTQIMARRSVPPKSKCLNPHPANVTGRSPGAKMSLAMGELTSKIPNEVHVMSHFNHATNQDLWITLKSRAIQRHPSLPIWTFSLQATTHKNMERGATTGLCRQKLQVRVIRWGIKAQFRWELHPGATATMANGQVFSKRHLFQQRLSNLKSQGTPKK